MAQQPGVSVHPLVAARSGGQGGQGLGQLARVGTKRRASSLQRSVGCTDLVAMAMEKQPVFCAQPAACKRGLVSTFERELLTAYVVAGGDEDDPPASVSPMAASVEIDEETDPPGMQFTSVGLDLDLRGIHEPSSVVSVQWLSVLRKNSGVGGQPEHHEDFVKRSKVQGGGGLERSGSCKALRRSQASNSASVASAAACPTRDTRGAEVPVLSLTHPSIRLKAEKAAQKQSGRRRFFLSSLQQELHALQEQNRRLKDLVQQHLPKPRAAEVLGACDEKAASTNPSKVKANLYCKADDQMLDVLQVAQQSFVITDPNVLDNPIIWASDSFCELTGYELGEVIGRNCKFLQGPETDPRVVRKLRQAINGGYAESLCLVNYRKDGTPFWNNIFISPLFDKQRRVKHFIGVQCDVTASYVPRPPETLDDSKGGEMNEFSAKALEHDDSLTLSQGRVKSLDDELGGQLNGFDLGFNKKIPIAWNT